MMRDEDSLIVFPLQALITRYKIEDFFFLKKRSLQVLKIRRGLRARITNV